MQNNGTSGNEASSGDGETAAMDQLTETSNAEQQSQENASRATPGEGEPPTAPPRGGHMWGGRLRGSVTPPDYFSA